MKYPEGIGNGAGYARSYMLWGYTEEFNSNMTGEGYGMGYYYGNIYGKGEGNGTFEYQVSIKCNTTEYNYKHISMRSYEKS